MLCYAFRMNLQTIPSLVDRIHEQALEACSRYKKVEAELIEILIQAEQHRVFLKRGHASLFAYVVGELGLSEPTAYKLITVSRKASLVPELKEEIRKGSVSLSHAKLISPVLNSENKAEWLEKASTFSLRALEKEVVKVRPSLATRERASYTAPSRIKLELGLSEKNMLKLRRAQDLLSQSQKRVVTLEETLVTLTGEYLHKHDPLEKAKRQMIKGKLTPQSPSEKVDKLDASLVARTPIQATTLHQVNLRDQRRCTHTNSNDIRCNQTRWLEIHHIIPVSQGGTNELTNLITLCSAHHDFTHLK